MKIKRDRYNWLVVTTIVLLVSLGCSTVNQAVTNLIEDNVQGTVAALTDCTPARAEAGLCIPDTVEAIPTEPVTTPPPPIEQSIPPTLPPAPTLTEVPPPTSPPATTAPPLETGCAEDVCVISSGFPLAPPIAPPGRDFIDVSYRFGSNNRGKRETHHGVEFLNSLGTPVLAAADGVVVLAGDDLDTIYGLYRNFYGNFVVLQHDLPGFSQPVFTLYAHLSEYYVKEGEPVASGQKIAEVGSTGAATGSHLHFEVRFGENNYWAARNPELWLAPLPDRQGQARGAIAGRILDGQGNMILIPNIVVERLSGPGLPASETFYVTSYAEKKLTGLEPWNESFAIGGLPAGEYQISFIRQGFQQSIVQVFPGQLTVVTFRVEE